VSSALQGLDAVCTALDIAKSTGAACGDALLVESDGTEVRVRGEEIDFVTQARGRTLGIRVFVRAPGGLCQAVTSTSDLAREAVEQLARDSVRLARATAPDPDAGLPEEGFASELPDLQLLDPADRKIPVETRIEEARRAEQAARSVDPRVVNSEGSEAACELRRVAYANSEGFTGAYESAFHSLIAQPVVAQNGSMQSDYWLSVSRDRAHLDTPEAVGEEAARRALAQLGARPVPTAEVPVIFDATSARSLLANLASCVSGYAVYRKSSFLAERMGQPIASPLLQVIDDGRRPRGLGSRPFDGEGLPTRRTLVVAQGRLESWLLDSYSGRKLGLPSTGNATRSAGGSPGAGPSNLWLEPGVTSLDEMVQNTTRGLLVTGLFGHGFNAVTGDFSRGARGWWIEAGQRVHPVEEITVAGNLGEMLRNIDVVGSELLWLGSIAAPPLRVARMTVAGT